MSFRASSHTDTLALAHTQPHTNGHGHAGHVIIFSVNILSMSRHLIPDTGLYPYVLVTPTPH